MYLTIDEEKNIIEGIKRQFPEYKDERFSFYGYEVAYTSGLNYVDIHKVTKWVSKTYGINPFQVTLKTYVTVYARDKEEAKKIALHENPKISPSYAEDSFITRM